MNKIITLSLLMLLLVSSLVFAEVAAVPTLFVPADAPASVCESFLAEYSVAGAVLPEDIPFKNELIHIMVAEDAFASVTLVNGEITSATCTLEGDATIIVTMATDSVLDTVLASDDPVSAYLDAKSNGDIKIEGVSTGTSLKLFFINVGLKISSWF